MIGRGGDIGPGPIAGKPGPRMATMRILHGSIYLEILKK
jgi:hypothetical protein